MEKCIAKNVLTENNIKITHQRLEVLQTIINLCKPFTALNLFLITKNDTGIDLATVYRILKIFLEKRLIREVVNSEEGQFFEISCKHNPVHPHFICTNCNEITCLKEYDYTKMKLYKKHKNDFLVNTVSVIFKGVCKECMKKLSKEGKSIFEDKI